MEKDNLLDRLINQLNTLIPFIAITHKEVFDLIVKEKYSWLPQNNHEAFPDSYEIYKTQIICSAFLLGYSYFEVFLSDLAREIYKSNPRMLPKDKQLKFNEILDATTYDDVIDTMINREVHALFYQGMDRIAEYFEQKFNLTWPNEKKSKIVYASLIRNCILHNMSRADDRLSKISDYSIGQEIQLNSSEIHSFGIDARGLARQLYKEASTKYFRHNEKQTA